MNRTQTKKEADRGWAAMRALLDQEMPVRKKRRRLAWLWWPAALLLLGGSGFGLWQLVGSKATPKTEQPPAAPNPMRVMPAPVATLEQAPMLMPTPALTQAPAHPPAHSNARNHASAHDAGAPARARLAMQGHPLPNISVSEWPADRPATVAAVNAAAPGAVLLADHRQLPAASETRSLEPVPALPISLVPLSPRPACFPDLPAFPLLPDDASAEKNSTTWRHWACTAQVATLTRDFHSLDGFTLGLTADWQPLRHWGLRTGLGYRYEQPRPGQRPVVSLPRDNYAADTKNNSIEFLNSHDTTSGAVADPAPAFVRVPVEHLHYLEAPLLVYWQPSRKWRVYGGVVAGWLVGARASEEYSVNGAFQTYSLGAGQRKALSRSVYQNLSDRQLDGCLGASLPLGRRMELSVLYRVGGSRWLSRKTSIAADTSWGGQYDPKPTAESLSLQQRRQRLAVGLGIRLGH